MVSVSDSSHVNYIISSMPRGGFSGGLVFSEWGFVLGLVTRSLLVDDQTPEPVGLDSTNLVCR
jgi:hypothetical protein